MVLTIASNTLFDARRAQIKIAHLAFSTMVMFIGHGSVAMVAVNTESGGAEIVEGGQGWPAKLLLSFGIFLRRLWRLVNEKGLEWFEVCDIGLWL